MKLLAKLFWRLLPAFIRRELAIAAPVVLYPHEYHGPRSDLSFLPAKSWLRHEVDVYPRAIWAEDDETIHRWQDWDGVEHPTEELAFAAITAGLITRRDVVLANAPETFPPLRGMAT